MIENTTKRDPLVHLLGAMSDGSSDYITGMEAAGQRQFVHSEQFPTEAPITDLEALGFTFGPVDEHDPLFRPATLPQGWSREGSDHALWSYIVDEKGRRRVSIFYKAAFYDRSAHAGLIGPHYPLMQALYADDEPTAVTLDELTTAEFAREYLRKQRENDLYYIDLIRGQAGDVTDREAKVTRIDLLLKLVERAAAEVSA